MPRSNWKGAISFGLVSIPISLINSEDNSQKVFFHQIDNRNQARIKYLRVNTETGKEVTWENIIKGYEYDKETILPVDEGELKKVVGDNARTIEIETFINENDIQYIDIKKTYYLLPEKKGEKGYVILRECLNKTKKIGIAKVIISTKEYLAAVATYQDALVLYLLRYHDEFKPLADFNFPSAELKHYKVTNKEIEIANQLIKAMSSKWKPDKYKDEYQSAIHTWAENKIKHQPISKMAQRHHAVKTTAQTPNFVELLRKSLGSGKKHKPSKKTSVIASTKKKSHNRRANLH